MHNVLKNPKWVGQFMHPYGKVEEIPEQAFKKINSRLDLVISQTPLVTIIISAWNEEVNIFKCISSLAFLETNIPFDIIVVDNNSSDKTSKTISKLHIKHLFQPIQGCGPARQLGQENALGKFILLADADCLYPSCWIDEMMKILQQPSVVCVYGRYSFLAEEGFPRWKLFTLEKLKDIIAEVRHFKRPYLNAYGISMGYVKEYGLKVGFVMYKIWGDDGRLCFDLMKFGKVKQVRANIARAWTGPRTLSRDGSFSQALKARIVKEIKRVPSMFSAHKNHDTKTSSNN